jgi:hypothetical protein
MEQRGGQLGASATERMTQSDRSAVDVDFGWVETLLLHHGQRLRGKSLI